MIFHKNEIKKFLFIALLSSFLLSQDASANENKIVFSNTYHIKKIYPSMEGPQSSHKFSLIEKEPRQLLWITGYESQTVEAQDSSKPIGDFMCHSNLNINMKTHRRLFNWKKYPSTRLFTLSEGVERIQFPNGFGVPVYSDELFRLDAQALNHNIQSPDLKVKLKNTISFVRDADLKQPMQPLFMAAANGLVLLSGRDGYYGISKGHPEKHGHGAVKGVKARSAGIRKDNFGRKFSGHWVVRPGRHTYKTLVTRWMNIPYDAKAHYITAHVHPFAESIALRDLKTNEILFETKIENKIKEIGLTHVPVFSSVEGIPIKKDREYELISVYNNTSNKNITVMAVMFLYLEDKEFDRSKLDKFAKN
jgi:hypothetical protein